MIIEILHKNYDGLFVQLTIVMLAWILVILSIGIDLHFGIKKSKQLILANTKPPEKVVSFFTVAPLLTKKQY